MIEEKPRSCKKIKNRPGFERQKKTQKALLFKERNMLKYCLREKKIKRRIKTSFSFFLLLKKKIKYINNKLWLIISKKSLYRDGRKQTELINSNNYYIDW